MSKEMSGFVKTGSVPVYQGHKDTLFPVCKIYFYMYEM